MRYRRKDSSIIDVNPPSKKTSAYLSFKPPKRRHRNIDLLLQFVCFSVDGTVSSQFINRKFFIFQTHTRKIYDVYALKIHLNHEISIIIYFGSF